MKNSNESADSMIPVKEHSMETTHGSRRTMKIKTTFPLAISARALFMTPKSLRYNAQKRAIAALRRKYNQLKRVMNSRMKNKNASKSNIETLIKTSAKFLTREAHDMFAAQLKIEGDCEKSKAFLERLNDIALHMYYHSPKAYKSLQVFVDLPSEQSLRTYSKQFPILPELNETVLRLFEKKFKNAPMSERVVSFLFHEMKILPGDETDAKKTALVGMVKWVDKNLKQVVGYCIRDVGHDSAKSQDLILSAIDKINDSGLIVKSIVCEQNARNQEIAKNLNITDKKPYFERHGHKVYMIFDAPHLLNSLKNNLKTTKFKYKGGIVDWEVLRKVYALSKEKPLGLIRKISHEHFEKSHSSKVSHAWQIFSYSMCCAIYVYQQIFPEKFREENDKTLEFVLDMDKLFDTLNSSVRQKTIDVKLNFAIKKNSSHIEFLRDIIEEFETAKFARKSQPACLEGFRLTMNAVLQLSEELREKYEIEALLTRRLNKDDLRKSLALIRRQDGCTIAPTAMQFEKGIHHMLNDQLFNVAAVIDRESSFDEIFEILGQIKYI